MNLTFFTKYCPLHQGQEWSDHNALDQQRKRLTKHFRLERFIQGLMAKTRDRVSARMMRGKEKLKAFSDDDDDDGERSSERMIARVRYF